MLLELAVYFKMDKFKNLKYVWNWLVISCVSIGYLINGIIAVVVVNKATNYTYMFGLSILVIFYIPSVNLLIKNVELPVRKYKK